MITYWIPSPAGKCQGKRVTPKLAMLDAAVRPPIYTAQRGFPMATDH